ncbi:MAG: hypothetical protein V4519_02180 [Patescibacteria group bacterium]
MKTRSKVHAIAALLLIGALIFLGIIWWINGREDTWLYITCVVIMLPSFITIFFKKENKDQ